jgi:hypothetical protein
VPAKVSKFAITNPEKISKNPITLLFSFNTIAMPIKYSMEKSNIKESMEISE